MESYASPSSAADRARSPPVFPPGGYTMFTPQRPLLSPPPARGSPWSFSQIYDCVVVRTRERPERAREKETLPLKSPNAAWSPFLCITEHRLSIGIIPDHFLRIVPSNKARGTSRPETRPGETTAARGGFRESVIRLNNIYARSRVIQNAHMLSASLRSSWNLILDAYQTLNAPPRFSR